MPEKCIRNVATADIIKQNCIGMPFRMPLPRLLWFGKSEVNQPTFRAEQNKDTLSTLIEFIITILEVTWIHCIFSPIPFNAFVHTRSNYSKTFQRIKFQDMIMILEPIEPSVHMSNNRNF